MSGLAKTCPGGQVLTAKQRKYFYFFRNYTFPFLLTNLLLFTKSCVLPSKSTEDKSLSQNQDFYFLLFQILYLIGFY